MGVPYYQDDLVTIYHGDCREIAPALTGVTAIVTDPPYGINLNPIRSRYQRIAGDAEPFDPAPWLALGLPTVFFGANHFADRLPSSPLTAPSSTRSWAPGPRWSLRSVLAVAPSASRSRSAIARSQRNAVRRKC